MNGTVYIVVVERAYRECSIVAVVDDYDKAVDIIVDRFNGKAVEIQNDVTGDWDVYYLFNEGMAFIEKWEVG